MKIKGCYRIYLLFTIWLCALNFFLFGAQENSNQHGYDIIPHEKNLDPAWVKSLTTRGGPLDRPVIGSKENDTLKYIGMTVGGIGCGTVYLNGDGRLFIWDIFNQHHEGVIAQHCDIPDWLGGRQYSIEKHNQGFVRERNGANYINPPTPDKFPNFFKQEFTLHDGVQQRSMDTNGWQDISFLGKWPVGYITYKDPASPVEVTLKAFSPFIPLNVKDSSLPVTVMEYTIQNTSSAKQEIRLSGILENPLGHFSQQQDLRETEKLKDPERIGFEHRLRPNDRPLPDSESKRKPNPKGSDRGTISLVYHGGDKASVNAQSGTVNVNTTIPAGQSKTVRFLIAWHLPNTYNIPGLGFMTHHYAADFESADDVAAYVINEYGRLAEQTDLWVNTWYDATLPHWLMDRSIIPLNTLQTANCFIFDRGEKESQFWSWEGIGACGGTCTHVWHYAQAMARIFPSLERNLREVTDFGMAIQKNGKVPFRVTGPWAWDGQCGTVLRSYREHLMSADEQFLKRNWDKIKRATNFLIEFDKHDKDGHNGIPNGRLHMTLDADWYGKVHELCSLYLAALRAGEEMAKEAGDTEFENLCRKTFEMGRVNIEELFNGEFYEHLEDPDHPNVIGPGKGVYIDQVMGQFWGFQVGLGRIHDETNIRSALNSLWKYNYLTDMGPFRARFPEGRFYSVPGDGGLLICTWPKGGLKEEYRKHWQFMYFNETMSGYEHQVAAHMVAEGTPELLERGLAIMRTIHDRYAPHKRNPYNEIECSDHYARAMASYGTFLSACGFDYHGPKGHIGFSPRLTPENFRAPFTAAEGWGTFSQKRQGNSQIEKLSLKWGKLHLSQMSFELPVGKSNIQTQVVVKGKNVNSCGHMENNRVIISLKEPAIIAADQEIEVKIQW